MQNVKRFLFSNDPEERVKVIDSVPKNWAWVDGIIRFPKDQMNFRQIAFDTGYAISHLNSSRPSIVGSAVQGSNLRNKPDLQAIIVERKLPSFIMFDMAGYDNNQEFAAVCEIACAYVRRGYVGWLKFAKSEHLGNRNINPATCEFRFAGSGEGRSEVIMKWNESCGGRPKDLKDILTACYTFNLEMGEVKSLAYT